MGSITPTSAELPEEEPIEDLLRQLRAPITTIKTALSLLESTGLKPQQRRKYLDMIRAECDRQNALLDSSIDLLAVDKYPLDGSVSNVEEVLSAVVNNYQYIASERGIKISCQILPNLPSVICPEAWLKQIARNLLDNSINFTAKGGAISVQTALQGDLLQLEFRDNGVGIQSADLPKIFDRFYRGRNQLEGQPTMGVGLGLTIVQKILWRCGGSISVVSQTDTGSRFRVLLPTLPPG
jgi:two-component system, OmpR family, phosphate regulon sensor histidine kinase PhoR